MKCNNCGTELLNGAKICYRCGASQSDPTLLARAKYCQHCGSMIGEDFVVCPRCGKQVATNPTVTYSGIQCPKCGSFNVSVQREQTGNISAFQNQSTVTSGKRSKGCLYWVLIVWWVKPMKLLLFDWWFYLLFGRKRHGGINFAVSKAINHTIAVCQNCGNTWQI